jgi:hypothetical protein
MRKPYTMPTAAEAAQNLIAECIGYTATTFAQQQAFSLSEKNDTTELRDAVLAMGGKVETIDCAEYLQKVLSGPGFEMVMFVDRREW